MRDYLRSTPALLIALVVGFLTAMAVQYGGRLTEKVFGVDIEPRPVLARGSLGEEEQATISLFESRKSSVVFITTLQEQTNPWTGDPMQVRSGTGSGFVWDEKGHIVTNNHVVAGAGGALVNVADGRSFQARLVGTDPEHDLAVLRIETLIGRPPALALGTSHDLKVGQKVFAIGNPFGLDWTLTTGIVSALNRQLPTEDGATITGLIQTDAAINPGNSGGPLLDSAGRLIGVNTAIFSPSGASAGIGFAVPVDTVNRVVPQLISKGRYTPPTIGVIVDEEVNKALSQTFGIEGVFVLDVERDSPAEQAGIRPARLSRSQGFIAGDIIISLNTVRVRTPAEYVALLDEVAPGGAVTLGLRRGSSETQVTISASDN
ncbi:peptidase PDZ domain-containing protein (plasmid) [Rhizobium etli 8C-3]|uniref:Peptidase PDZ domain-containing protein n=1 Tax=Rhizobium etli 8C-3 TaxID=538025 RepID=A0A1L5PC76_RHIET|nr:peptidase PDZ domain-containing protein [Rhizobium etli 8C-3]